MMMMMMMMMMMLSLEVVAYSSYCNTVDWF